jgi:tripartite-type tricarboxylate transporter receptor subunit TctC
MALQYDVVKDFEPIVLLATSPLLIVAKKTVPATNLKDLIAWLKTAPDKASAGTGGVGSPQHIASLHFQKLTDTRFGLVAYRGGILALPDLLSGQLDLMIDVPSSSLPQVRAGSLKAFAVTAKNRLTVAADIPTVDEAGLPQFYISNWIALFAPKNTPRAAVEKLNGAVIHGLGDQGVRSKLAELGFEIPPRELQSPEALAAFHKAEIERWWPIIRTAGIKTE